MTTPICPDQTGIATIAVALATVVLAAITYLSVREVRHGQRALSHPILVPTNVPNQKDLVNATERPIDVANVGTGVATDIWGVLFPQSTPQPWVPRQLSLRHTLPLRSGEVRAMTFSAGGTMFTEKDRIGPFLLTVPPELAPERGFPNPLDRRERVIARLTLTCRDSFGLRHAAVFDLDWLGHWVSVATSRQVRRDLRDLDAGKGLRASPRRSPPAA